MPFNSGHNLFNLHGTLKMSGMHPKSHSIQCWFWKTASPWEWKTWAHFPGVSDKAALIHLHFYSPCFSKTRNECGMDLTLKTQWLRSSTDTAWEGCENQPDEVLAQVLMRQKSFCFHLYSGLSWHDLNVLVSSIGYQELGVRTQFSRSALSFLPYLTILKAEPMVHHVPHLHWEHSWDQLWLFPFLLWSTTVCESRQVTTGTTPHNPQTFA